jgi:hypothetical protein
MNRRFAAALIAVVFLIVSWSNLPEPAQASIASPLTAVAGVGLSDGTLLYENDPFPNDNFQYVPGQFLTGCPVTPIGIAATDGSRIASFDTGFRCASTENLVLNGQRTHLATILNSGGSYTLVLYDVSSDGTLTRSPNQVYPSNSCNVHVNPAWTPDGSIATCFHGSVLVWENVLTGAGGIISDAQLGVPTDATSSANWLPDGSLLVSAGVAGCLGTAEWIIPMSGMTPIGPPAAVGPACPTEQKVHITVSADGAEQAYVGTSLYVGEYGVTAVAPPAIEISAPSGSNERTLVGQPNSSANDGSLAWSPDGRFLLVGTVVPSFDGQTPSRSGISAVDAVTGVTHWVLPPQPTFDARYPVSANVPDVTPTNLLQAAAASVVAVNGDPGVTSAPAGDTLTVTGSGFDPSNPPTTLNVCDSAGTTCLTLPVENVTIDSLGNLSCTVVIPATWTPTSSTGGQTTGTPGGTQSTAGLTFSSGSASSPTFPSPGLYLSPNHGLSNTQISVGVDYLSSSQTVMIAAFASSDGSGSALPGAIVATADPCGCLTTSFTVPAGTHSIAALNASSRAVIAQATWYPADPISQTVVFTSSPPTGAYAGGSTYVLAATASSSLAVGFDSATASICTVSGSVVSFISAGTCTIDASQAGDANYSAAPIVTQAVSVSGAPQAISFTSQAPAGAYFGGPGYAVTAGSTSGLPVTFASATDSICTVSGSRVSFVGVGTCTISISQAGDEFTAPAGPVLQSFAVERAAQSIAFASSPPTRATVGGATYEVTATATSGLPVALTSTTSSVCTVAGPVVSFISTGACTIAASQPGNANWAPTSSASQSFTVTPKEVVLTTKDQCKNGGWATSTQPVFPNQGQCVSYFASGKK